MSDSLITIDCDYVQPALACAYLRISQGECAFIETNTAHAVPKLLAALAAQGRSPADVRYVIVTHVHLDHAGGASALMEALPNATLLAHPRAARHLIDPSRIIAGATAVYGAEQFAALYGTIRGIDASRVRSLEDGAEVPFGAGRSASSTRAATPTTTSWCTTRRRTRSSPATPSGWSTRGCSAPGCWPSPRPARRTSTAPRRTPPSTASWRWAPAACAPRTSASRPG
ncbi:MAG: MBL fold metallo-hydrolase [Deltaproteobacteria bacterium]|nr:MBL fold metallo-hydrolase [Deltaproteobacteria bacterium]